MDGMNFAGGFFGYTKRPGVWNITASFKRVAKLVEAAERSQIMLKCFLDDTAPSEEASKKWKTRRVREIRAGEKNVPQGSGILLGDMFRELGIEVYYSDVADNDDTLAFYAQHDGADVLSGDKDMFRYVGSTFKVYDSWHFSKQGELILKEKKFVEISEKDLREIGPLPRLKDRVSHTFGGVVKRGTVTCLTRRLGLSPHRVITPLRHALYNSLGVTGPIAEHWPEWVNNHVEWYEKSDIYPERSTDDYMIDLLQRPDDAFMHFQDALCATNDISKPPPSIKGGCTALRVEMTKINEDIRALEVKIANHINEVPRDEASKISHEKQGIVFDQDLKMLKRYKKSLNITKDEWHRHNFCVRSLVFELCSSRPGNHKDTLLNYWLLHESKQEQLKIERTKKEESSKWPHGRAGARQRKGKGEFKTGGKGES